MSGFLSARLISDFSRLLKGKDQDIGEDCCAYINQDDKMFSAIFSDGQKRERDQDDEYQGRKRQRGEGNRVDLRILLQSKVRLTLHSKSTNYLKWTCPCQFGPYHICVKGVPV